MLHHDLRTFPAHKHLRTFGAFVLGALCAFQVNAQVNAPSSAFDAFMWNATGGGQQTISFGSNGTPLVTPSSAVVSTDGGLPKVTQSASLKNPSGNHVPVSMLSRVPVAKVASMLMGGIGGALVLQTGVALYDLAKEHGFTLTKTPTGVTATKSAGVSPTAWSPLPTFSSTGILNLPTCPASWTTWRTPGYCRNVSPSVVFGWVNTATKDSLVAAGWTYVENATTMHGLYKVYSNPTVAPDVSAELQELADAIAAQSGWPSTSKVSQALVDAAAITGTKIQPDVQTVTGPATSVGKVTTTVNTTNNTTKTETVTHNHSYAGNTVNTSTVTVTNIIDNSTGAVTSSETKTEAPVTTEPAVDPCIANPTRNGCRVDEFDVPAGEIPKETRTITFSAENLGFAGGTCPANRMLTMHQSGQTVTAGDWATTCDMTVTYAKPMILVMATFAALMIIFGFGSGRSES